MNKTLVLVLATTGTQGTTTKSTIHLLTVEAATDAARAILDGTPRPDGWRVVAMRASA